MSGFRSRDDRSYIAKEGALEVKQLRNGVTAESRCGGRKRVREQRCTCVDEQLELCARITDAGVVEDQQRAARSGYGRRMRSRDR